MKSIDVRYFKLNLQGLSITYTYGSERTSLDLCPGAFCELLKETKLIEDFTLDQNSEPVILFADNHFPPGYGFDRWSSFVRTFHISYQMAVGLMQYREERLESVQVQATIIHLLAPLQAA